MARKPPGKAPYAAFAELLDGHLRAGRRPDPEKREPWSDTAFAKTQPGRGDAAGVSPRTVANWRKGTSLPLQIEPILAALFGPLRRDGGADREALRTAYDAALLPRSKLVLETAAPAPEGLQFAPMDDQRLIIVAVAQTDRQAAEDSFMRQRHAVALDKVRDLVGDVGSRLDNQRAWRGLPRAAQRLLGALDGPAEAMADRLVALYDHSVSLASFIDQDDAFGRSPNAMDDPLDADVRRVLADALSTLAPWLRGFPTVLGWDSARRDFLARPELFETVRERLAEVGPTIDAATRGNRKLLSTDDADLARAPLETAQRPGVQGEKSGYRAVGTTGNLVVAATAVMASFFSGAVASDYATRSPLVQAAGSFLARAESTATGIIAGLPDDVRAAVRHVMAMHKADEERQVALPAAAPLAAVATSEPPADFDLGEVKRMILAGRAPPHAWVPFITSLAFNREPLRDLDPLRRLTSLKRLDLYGTEVRDFGPLKDLSSLLELQVIGAGIENIAVLAGLRQLEALTLSATKVSDLRPLDQLSSLRYLSLEHTRVRDLEPLRGLTGLSLLILNATLVNDLGPLSGLTALNSLMLRGTAIRDVNPLRALVNLETLHLDGTPVRDIDPLRPLTRLEILSLSDTHVEKLEALRELTDLRILWLDGTQAHDLEPLRQLSRLWMLMLDGSPIDDLLPLRGLKSLRRLSLRRTKVRSLAPLSGLPDLRVLDCLASPIEDIAPLTSLESLAVLRIPAKAIHEWDILNQMPALRYLDLVGDRPSKLRGTVVPAGMTLEFNAAEGGRFDEAASAATARKPQRLR